MAAVESPAFDARRIARELISGEDYSPIVYAHGRGSNVIDVDGNRYVDLTAGFGALLLGHGPNAALEAAAKMSTDLPLALGDVYASETKLRACEAIASLHPVKGARVMLGLSGADAVTCALKTALLATGKPGVIAFEGSYHGLSYGPLAALGFAPGFREPFAQHLGIPVEFAPFPGTDLDSGRGEALDRSLSAVRAALAEGKVGAILVEPILGRGGCVVPPAEFLPELRALATEAGALLIVDEIWTGLGRTGTMLASEGVVPDVLCLGKGLGGGFPISACVGTPGVMAAWGGHGGSRIHTGTHFGSPPSCAAALATIETIQTTDLAARARSVGDAWRRELGERAIGRGLMVGIKLADAATALATARELLTKGFIVLTGGVRGDTLTLSPPLTIAPELLTAFAQNLS